MSPKVFEAVDRAATLNLLDAYVRIPTISSQITPDMVAQVQAFWHDLGLDFELMWPSNPISSHINNPALFAQVEASRPGAPTLLLYGHWDVQPTGDPEEWRWHDQPCPPFEPTYFVDDTYVGRNPAEVTERVERDELDRVTLIARGSADNKGQHLANILGVLGAKRQGQLAWNVKILLDGEEEAGSPNLASIVQTHRAQLSADFMVGSDGPKSDNRPTLLLGVRGLLAVTVRSSNGTNRLLHSGNYGNVTPNPVLPLTRLLDEMEAAVKEMSQASESFRQGIARYFDTSGPDFARYAPFLHPTFNINSFISEGATRGQRRTIIPGWAEASVDVRLTPGLSPRQVYATLEALTAKANRDASGIEFSIVSHSACAASYTSPEREGYAWLKGVAERFWQQDLRVIPLLGGTLPNDVFTDDLGLASYWLPAANSNNRQHDTNEHFVLEHFFKQQEFYSMLASTPYSAAQR